VFDAVEHGWDLDFGGLYPEVPKSKMEVTIKLLSLSIYYFFSGKITSLNE
jgi:hypothetical protein